MEEEKGRMHPYAQLAIQGILVVGFAGLVLAILGIAAAIVAWSWGLIG
jgi:hypothetical protein